MNDYRTKGHESVTSMGDSDPRLRRALEETDTLDAMAGIDAATPLFALRRARPEYVAGVEACRASVLTPEEDHHLPSALRTAAALRMARRIGVAAQVDIYRRRLAALAPDAQRRALADGARPETLTPWLAVVAMHCDNVTQNPARCDRRDIERLQRAGMSTPQIVALSELIAFINFESRVAAGLAALGGTW